MFGELMFIWYILNGNYDYHFTSLMTAKQVVTFSIVEMTKYITVLCI